jgi:hypothetical protein
MDRKSGEEISLFVRDEKTGALALPRRSVESGRLFRVGGGSHPARKLAPRYLAGPPPLPRTWATIVDAEPELKVRASAADRAAERPAERAA